MSSVPSANPPSSAPARARRAVLALSTFLAAYLASTAPTLAQSVAASDVNMGSISRRIEHIEPRGGPPGTVVRVNTADMPVITPIRVGIGAAQFGFEAFHELLTGQEGEFDVSVEVPAWASWERIHLFIVFDIYFRPIALSDAFHVTDARGMVRRTGRVTRSGTDCTLFRDIDGVQYALTGDASVLGALPANERVVLEGRMSDREVCGFRNVLEVVEQRTD